MKRVLILTLGFVGATLQAQQTDPTLGPYVGSCYEVHGRLQYYNGGPSTRIWIIRTHRMLGVPSEDSHLPKNIKPLFKDFGDIIFADFVVCPLTKEREGHMRDVVIQSASHVIHHHEDY